MSWRDQLQPGSFRGATFLWREASLEGGRRGELHSFPERDKPWFEDLGMAPARWMMTAIVIGPDYMADRDALEKALNAKGPGTLVHPTRGTLSAIVERFSSHESTSEGGMAIFEIDFADPGEPVSIEQADDTSGQAQGVADDVQDEAPAEFEEGFSVADFPAFVEDAAADLVAQISELAVALGQGMGGAGAQLRAFDAGISALGFAKVLVRSPAQLGGTLLSMIGALGSLGSSPAARVSAMRTLMLAPASFDPVYGATPARARQRANQDALSTYVILCAAAEAVRATASLQFTSYDEAAAFRDAFGDQLDAAALTAADTGDDHAYDALDGLRIAMVRDVTARGGSLERLYAYTPAVTEPAEVIAHRLYRDPATLLDRTAELIARNGIIHPGFVAGGEALQVLSDGAIGSEVAGG